MFQAHEMIVIDKTYINISEYAVNMLEDLLNKYEESPRQLASSIDHIRANIPPPLSDQYEKVDKYEAIEQYERRFSINDDDNEEEE